MSGDNELSRLKEKSDKFEQSIGLGVLERDVEECEHLNIKGKDIEKLTPEQCGQIAVDLAGYGLYIQRTLSKEVAFVKWFEAKINQGVAPELNSFVGYYSSDQRKSMAISNDEYLRKVEDMRQASQFKIDMLSQIPFQINQLVKTLLEAQTSKRFQRA